MKFNFLILLLFESIILHRNFVYCFSSDDLSKFDSYLNSPTNIITVEKDFKKEIQCRLCTSMFSINFNYDKLLNNKEELNKIKQTFSNESYLMKNNDIKSYFSKDNISFVLKEISMQFFFKGGINQFDGDSIDLLTKCRGIESNNYNCDKLKLKLCGKLLSFDRICELIHETQAHEKKEEKSEVEPHSNSEDEILENTINPNNEKNGKNDLNNLLKKLMNKAYCI